MRRPKSDDALIKRIERAGGYICYFDGCCEPINPGGTAGYGALILRGRERVWEDSGVIPASPQTSNNVAEYRALCLILDWFIERELTAEQIVVAGDSNLVIQQMFGRWKIKKGFYVAAAREAQSKIVRFANLNGTWIPRERNQRADDLSKSHLRKARVKFRIQPELPDRPVIWD